MRTEVEDDAAALGEDTHHANVLRPHGVLNAGGKQTGGTEDRGALHAGLDGVYWVVRAGIVTVGRHLWSIGEEMVKAASMRIARWRILVMVSGCRPRNGRLLD